jgi:hypothetical protein
MPEQKTRTVFVETEFLILGITLKDFFEHL